MAATDFFQNGFSSEHLRTTLSANCMHICFNETKDKCQHFHTEDTEAVFCKCSTKKVYLKLSQIS